MATLVLHTFLFVLFTLSRGNELLEQARSAHGPVRLEDTQIRYLSELSNVTLLQEVLDNLLIPRVVNTPNHDKVQKYIVKQLRNLGWTIEIDQFQSKVPKFGVLTFKNLIATLNPRANRYLVLACHYDSKYFDSFDFIGATDSAVPCAMLINLAQVLKDDFTRLKNENELSLKLVFFDGEEAFVSWGPNDSIYGSKHLAAKWEENYRAATVGKELASDLNRIDLLVLLDLIGAKNPKFSCLIADTQRWYLRLSVAEELLAQMGLLKSYNRNDPEQAYFKKRLSYSFIEDDHIPFLERGVPILHLIPTPFPKVWHTEDDNHEVIDIDTIENLNKIFRLFVAEYLHLLVQP